MFLSPEELTIFFVETPTEIIGYTNKFSNMGKSYGFFLIYLQRIGLKSVCVCNLSTS
jgi:hypothetical protein